MKPDKMDMANLSDVERLNLEKMIKSNDAEDHTSQIRKLQHSTKIHNDVNKLIQLKSTWGNKAYSAPEEFERCCIEECNFIFTHYTYCNNICVSCSSDSFYIQHLY